MRNPFKREVASAPGDAGGPAVAGNAAEGSTGIEFIDAPESDPERDLLGRVPFAKRVAATVGEQSGKASVVVGLYGPWGDGKTTLLGFIAAELRSNDQVAVVSFNPWFYADEAQIFEDFLDRVAEALNVPLRSMRERIGRAAQQKVGPAVQGVSVGIGKVNAAGGVIGAAGGLLGNPTLRVLRDRLAEVLTEGLASGHTKRVVVFMDDIDRLDVEQIAAVFRMIKLAADFPSLSFLLAFDPNVVADALSGRYGTGRQHTGAAFLEKIVQVPLSVPKADASRVAAVLSQWLAEIMLSYCPQLPFEETARLQRAMMLHVWPHITTLRSGKRLLSTVRFVVPLMRDEVNPVDQVLLEALRLLFPDLYTLASVSKTILLSPLRGAETKVLLQQKIAAALESVPAEMHTSGQSLLQELFPHLDSLDANRWWGEEALIGWRRAKRVCSPSHFDRYFGYGLPVGDILDADVEAAFSTEPSQARDRLASLLEANDPALVVQKLFEQAHGRPADACAAVAVAVIGAMDVIGAEDGSYRLGGTAAAAGQLIALLLSNLPAQAREATAEKWLHQAHPWFAALCLNWFMLPAARDSHGEPLLPEEALNRLGREQAQRFVALAPGAVFTPGQIDAGFHVFAVCNSFGTREEAEELLAAALDADKELLQTLLASYFLPQSNLPFLNPLIGQGYARLTALVPADRVLTAVDKHFPDASGKVQLAIDATPGSPQIKQLVSGSDARAVQFLALHQNLRSMPPPTPATVFEPSGTRPARLTNLSPRSTVASTYSQQQPHLALRAAALRPDDAMQLVNPGSTPASSADDRTREKMLTEIVDRSELRAALVALCNACDLGQLPDRWTYRGDGVRETGELLLESSSWPHNTAPALKTELRISTGWAAQGRNQPPIEAVMGVLDITLRLPASGSGISLAQLRDALIAATALFEITREAGRLLPARSYDDGDGALWVVSNEPSFEHTINLDGLERTSSNSGQAEVWLNTTLPLAPAPGNTSFDARVNPGSPITALVVEAIRRLLQGDNRRGYEPALHDLLLAAARPSYGPAPEITQNTRKRSESRSD